MLDLTFQRNSWGGWSYRPLRLRAPFLRGADCHELQSALTTCGAQITPDGIFGPQTHAAVTAFQKGHGLVDDGIAGPATQRALWIQCCSIAGKRNGVDPARLRGQVEKESSGYFGVFTPRYADDSYDRGGVQENTRYYPSEERAFTVSGALADLCKKILEKYALYSGVKDEARRWGLSQGAWNSPSSTDTLARGGDLPKAEWDRISAYIEDVTVYAR